MATMRCLGMLRVTLTAWGLATAGIAAASNVVAPRSSWPNGPFVTSGRWIVDASGANVTYAGVNWPGHVNTMVPEGLQYESIEGVVSQIKSLGMNAIRLTYAIEMVDQIYDNGGQDVPIQKAFTDALGQENGTALFSRVIAKNPSFNNATTRLQVFDAVAAECAKQEIYVHLDNHVSQAGWCCNPFDGNSWWGDTYFSTANWTRGLSYMANHGKSWPNLMSMSLRNELRQPLDDVALYDSSYNWQTWYANIKQGAAAIHANNSDVLIFLSGLNSDTDLSAVVQGIALTPGTATFNIADFAGYSNKLVLELHNYDGTVANCSVLQNELYGDGFQTLSGNTSDNIFPMVMTEFGFLEDATTWQGVWPSCLEAYLPAQHAGWMIWVLAGSYYVREGTQDYDETWGLLTHDWSAWRSPEHVNGGLIPMVKATLEFLNQSGGGNSSGGGGSSSGGGSGSAGNGSKPSGARSRFGAVDLTGSLLPSCLLALVFTGFFCGMGL